MSLPFIGEIRMFAGTFEPYGWRFCEGQILQIADNEPLFSLIGTTYGGDGVNTFALPDLRSRIPVHQTFGYLLGGAGGTETVNLTSNTIPNHSHAFQATSAEGDRRDPKGALFARSPELLYGAPGTAQMLSGTMAATGGGQPHSNMQPYLCIHFIISLFGIWPSQT